MTSAIRSDLLISVILPLEQDASILPDVVRETAAILTHGFTHHEIILVAPDSDAVGTAAVGILLKTIPHLRLLLLSRDFGREAAIIAGLETAIGDYVVTLVAETDPPDLIPEMIRQCRLTDGMVIGVDDRGMSGGPVRLLLKRLFHRFMHHFLKAQLVPATTHFSVLSRRMVNALTQLSESSRQLRLLSCTIGYQRRIFPYTLLARSGRGGRKSFFSELNMGVELLTSHTRQPLRWLSWLASGGALLSILFMLCPFLISLLDWEAAKAWQWLSVQQSVMFFLLFVVLAVQSEYAGRLFDQTRGRPLYFIGDEKTSSVAHLEPEHPNVVHVSE